MKFLLASSLSIQFSIAHSQETFTRKDSLLGGLPFERTCYDVQHYNLDITIDPVKKSISGYNEIEYRVVEKTAKIQLDLFENMMVDSIVQSGKKLDYKREFGAIFISFPSDLKNNSSQILRCYYHGIPIEAPHAPWQGGIMWTKDSNHNVFAGVAVQGTGASLWFPVKDSQSDEPDKGATISIAVPNGLTAVSNGRFKGSEDLQNGYTKWNWEVVNPINDYDITANIGDYVHFSDSNNGLDLDYYVLRENEPKARRQFEGVKPMLDCFESKFGNYPFKEDGFKLVETPYLGMEHQSAVAYGNKYMNGYLGDDLSGTGIGMSFDYIIVHESGHEWFGNSITSRDIADMWIHEGFTMYAEAVYIECTLGKEKAIQYLVGMKRNIHNYDAVIGQFGVNNEGSGDMYYKGAWLVQTLRSLTNDDEIWWKTLKKYCLKFRHQIITTRMVCDYFSREMNMDLRAVFDQYLTTKKIPTLVFENSANGITYKYEDIIRGFSMPVDIYIGSKKIRIKPTESPQILNANSTTNIRFAKNDYLINIKGLN